jgi:hypothetical protein
MGRGVLLGLLGLSLIFVPAAQADVAYNCSAPCTITVSISNQYPDSEQQIIREVIADFNVSPEINLVEANGGKIKFVVGNDGFFTNQQIAGGWLKSARITIDHKWFGWCCDQHDGIRGVYCHELMHGLGINDGAIREQPSCFNGTSPYLGVEDRAWISSVYPLGG